MSNVICQQCNRVVRQSTSELMQQRRKQVDDVSITTELRLYNTTRASLQVVLSCVVFAGKQHRNVSIITSSLHVSVMTSQY